MGQDELVTVVIPARNEGNFIDGCLVAVRAQRYARMQIIVIDGGSTDATTSVVSRHILDDERVELLHNLVGTIPVSMNLGLQHARGRWLVRVDAHSTVGSDYVELAVSRLREGTWGGVGGRKEGVGKTPAGRAIAAAMGHRFGVGGSIYHYGTQPTSVDHVPFGAYSVALLRELGGWDERLAANEDYELDYRLRCAGHQLLFEPRMTIQWYCRQSIADLFRQYKRYGRGKFDVARLHPESLSPRHVLPPLWVAYLVLALSAGHRRPALTLGMISPYLLALGLASGSAARQLPGLPERLLVAPAFVAMHVGWGLGFWSGLATHGLRATTCPGQQPAAEAGAAPRT